MAVIEGAGGGSGVISREAIEAQIKIINESKKSLEDACVKLPTQISSIEESIGKMKESWETEGGEEVISELLKSLDEANTSTSLLIKESANLSSVYQIEYSEVKQSEKISTE